jgi:hypothetical protein
MGGYPEWVSGVPAKDCPWNDDTPDFMCEECEFHTNDGNKVEWPEDDSDAYWICPECGHKNET